MNIKTIVFGDYTDPAYQKLESVIMQSFSAVTGTQSYYPSVYDSVQAGLPEIAAALKTNEIIALFASDELYHEAKRCICKAFRFEMIHNESVLQKLSVIPNSERYMMHALMPKNATPFALSDGLFPGFAVRSRSQCVLFLPFSEDRTFITMKKFVFPYIQRICRVNLPNFNDFEITYAADVLSDQLEGTDIQVAVSNTPMCKYIAHAGKKIECFNDHISYAPFSGKIVGKNMSQNAAVQAAEYYECRFGAAVMEGERDAAGNYTATIIISNRRTATIRTLSSVRDESHEDFMNTVVIEFFLMLAQEIAGAPEMTAEELKCLKPKAAVHGIHILIYILLFSTTFFLTYVASSFSTLPFFS